MLIVSINEVLEFLSNEYYTTVLGRGVVKPTNEYIHTKPTSTTRTSWVVFAEPEPDKVLPRPLYELVSEQE